MNTTNDGAGGADVLAAMRRATATRHAALDSGLPLSHEAATLADYAAHLALLRDWLRPLHAALAQSGVGLPGMNRLGEIEGDLAHPSLAGLVAVRDRVGHCWPDDMSDAYRWGMCYVVEGSQLGARYCISACASNCRRIRWATCAAPTKGRARAGGPSCWRCEPVCAARQGSPKPVPAPATHSMPSWRWPPLADSFFQRSGPARLTHI